MKPKYCLILSTLLLISCGRHNEKADAYGNFEATEVLVSPEVQGRILEFPLGEGDRINRGDTVAVIDSTRLYLQKQQLVSGKASLRARTSTITSQLRANRVQLSNLEREKARIDHLYEGGAATERQREEIHGQVDLVRSQMDVTRSQLESVEAEQQSLGIQIEQVEDQLDRCTVRSPLDGVVLEAYRERGELAAVGQPLCKIAEMDRLILRAYITGGQLAMITTGDRVTVMFDRGEALEETTGIVSWISPQAEFTPRIIQTREERVSLVYAIEVQVANDGSLKIGMPGEVHFGNLSAPEKED